MERRKELAWMPRRDFQIELHTAQWRLRDMSTRLQGLLDSNDDAALKDVAEVLAAAYNRIDAKKE